MHYCTCGVYMCSQTACLKGSSLQHANTCTHTHTHNPHQNTCQCRNQTNLLKGSYTTQHVHNFFETTQPNQANHQPYPIVLYYVHRASPIMAKPTHPATNTQTHTHEHTKITKPWCWQTVAFNNSHAIKCHPAKTHWCGFIYTYPMS